MHNDPDILVQRFLDGELDRAGRQELLRRLGRDPALREQVVAHEAILDEVAQLPRLTASDAFIAQTLARAPRSGRTAGRILRQAEGRWWLAAAASVVLIAAGFLAGRVSGPAATPGEATTASIPAPEVVVRLVLVEPSARTVTIVGDFNGWDPMQSPLNRLGEGLWTTTLALPPGRYHYQFLVDGERWIADPFAQETTRDGFGAENSVLDVGV